MACRFHSGVYEETRKLRWATKQPKMRPCRHAEAGCPFASDLPAELKRHDRDCAYAPADCPYGCGVPLIRKQLVVHCAQCPKKPQTCPHA